MSGERRIDAVREADVVVLGAGVAGLSTALGLAGRRVDLLSKGPLARTGNSPWAQGGIAAAVGAGDAPALHAADTIAVAGALADEEAVVRLTREGPSRLAALVRMGARFDRDAAGGLDLAREAAHSRRRILHARDATGAEIVRVLRARLAEAGGVAVFEDAFALEVVTDGGRAAGVLALHADGAVVLHRARAVEVATGGIGRAWSRTTNPAEATGDGLALAWRAGARLADLEFVQFHPTALDTGEDPMPLLTEALRGAGARLVDEDDGFVVEGGDLQARDVVARSLWRALAEGRHVFLDARDAVGESFPERFPTVFAACQANGLDPRREKLPVAPAAHYHMGGVLTDLEGRTSLPGLWAAGEVACTGVHGANRLASNSLLEALVFGASVARSVADALAHLPRAPRRLRVGPTTATEPSEAAAASAVAALRRTMWESVGLVRDDASLRAALRDLESLGRRLSPFPSMTVPPEAFSAAGPAPCSRPVLEARNLLAVARLVATAALERRESRGAHHRTDYPTSDPAWRRRVVLTRRGDGIVLETGSVPAPQATSEVSA